MIKLKVLDPDLKAGAEELYKSVLNALGGDADDK